MEYLKEIAKFAKSFSLSQVPDEAIDKSKLLILDSLSAMVAGNQNREIGKLMKRISDSYPIEHENSTVPVLGLSEQLDFRMAALVNGIGMVSDELDEGNPLAKGHPAAHFFPALLSLSFEHCTPGVKMLEAFHISYEISARMGSVIQLKQPIHPHGNWGVFGNGFGIGKLLGWERGSDFIHAAMLATSFAMPTLWQSVLEGHKVRNVIIGLNNYHTTLLADLVEAGFSASLSTAKIVYKDILADSNNGFPDDLYDTHYLMKSYFKFYPYCRFCHSPVDAAVDLIKTGELKKIKEIKVKTYSSAAKLKAKTVPNTFAGKFSIPFSIASELYETHCQDSSFQINREEVIQFLMNRVTVFELEDYTELLPKKRVTTVMVEFMDGTMREKTVDRATGDPEEPCLKAKVLDKSRTLLRSHFGEKQSDDIIETILELEKQADITQLKEMLTVKT